MKMLFIEFSNGDSHIGKFYLYRINNNDLSNPSYQCSNYSTAMSFIPVSYWIRHEDGDEIYTIASIVKIKDITKEEWLANKRDDKLNQLL